MRNLGVLGSAVVLSSFAVAQAAAGQSLAANRARGAESAPAPVPPETITRTPEGAVTVRAVRIPEALKLDGRLDEPYYREIPSFGGFIQQEPQEGAPSSERTEAWVFFDNRNIYVGIRCWDSHPEREIANEMRRDSQNIVQNENVAVLFDTFHDRRNSVYFLTTPLGAQRDVAATDESTINADWSTVWDVKTQRSDQGWTAEYAIPFKSLRYNSDKVQIWGFQIRRTIRYKNEQTFLTALPAYLGIRATQFVSLGATLVGLETPPGGLNLEMKPYAISGLRTDLKATPAFEDKIDSNWGLDAKYGLSKSITLDLTYKTDFAQVEDDTQQVNLTRFNQFFPERREFFLEGQGLFGFGGASAGGGGGGGGGGGTDNTPILFFSRRIGLNNGRPVPILAGARSTGRTGRYSLGLLNIQSENDPLSASKATNFSVVRFKRDLLKRSTVGLMYTRREETVSNGAPPGQTFGVDALFSASPGLNLTTYYARTEKNGVRAPRNSNVSYLGRFDYNADRYGLQAEHLKVGERFEPEVGFLRRSDFVRSFLQARFSPRPARTHMKAVRRFFYQASGEYIENNQGRLDFREAEGQFQIELSSSDIVNVDYTNDYEYVPRPFNIASSNVIIPAGGYKYQNLLLSYQLGTQHRFAGTMAYQQGTLYDGNKRTLSLSSGRAEVTSQLAIEPTFSLNWLDLPGGKLTTSVVTARTTYTMTPRMFVSALTQYSSSSHTMSTNARFRWEYRPGSEAFVVYSDGRDTLARNFPPVVNRALVVKLNRLFRF